MCTRRAKKHMILSRSEYLIIFTPHRYRRTSSTTVSSPSVRGGHTPETWAGRLQPPQHFQRSEEHTSELQSR